MNLTPGQRSAARSMVNQFEQQVAAEQFAATANGPHVVVVLDPTLFDPSRPESIAGAASIEGIWPDYLSAADAAQVSAATLNDGNVGPSFVAVALPIHLHG